MTEEAGTAKTNSNNFNTISQSAKWLTIMKGYTSIPYARQTAEILLRPKEFEPDFSKCDFTFLARMNHFEYRYRTITQLLEKYPVNNIIELSSGFSFRGLDFASRKNVTYIDTDLPDFIPAKKEILNELLIGHLPLQGNLDLLPLNALDKKMFLETINRFPAGEIAIVNEGLLMYLNEAEQEKLFVMISEILKSRGGYWITADIYLKGIGDKLPVKLDNHTQQFLDTHNVEENKFESYEAAERLLNKCGLKIKEKTSVDISELSTFRHLMDRMTPEILAKLPKNPNHYQDTWCLTAI
jgi:O-methyltransferase involved in polyketide biosynthesis